MSMSMNMVASELVRGEEIARNLLAHIDSGRSIDETCRLLVLEMLSFFDKTILMVKSSAGTNYLSGPTAIEEVQPRREILFKKRKTVPKWTNKARLGTGPGAEGPVDDGYSWRKYGQKEILGAKHPRGYYRCTHQKSQGCLAMKQVQRSDDSPLLFDVTYRGTHTCQRKSTSAQKFNGELHRQNQDMLLSFQTGLKVKTEGLGSNSLPFSFPSTPVDSLSTENVNFSPSSTLDKSFLSRLSNAEFISPMTSESNYFSDFSADAATSASNSPILDMRFLLDSVDFDQDFPFDTSSFLTHNF